MIKGHIKTIIRRIKYQKLNQMTRKEGIIKQYREQNGGIYAGQIAQLLQTEYNNYTELCSFCSEQPKPMDIWLNETINPQK